jgi:hypothetical protein
MIPWPDIIFDKSPSFSLSVNFFVISCRCACRKDSHRTGNRLMEHRHHPPHSRRQREHQHYQQQQKNQHQAIPLSSQRRYNSSSSSSFRRLRVEDANRIVRPTIVSHSHCKHYCQQQQQQQQQQLQSAHPRQSAHP